MTANYLTDQQQMAALQRLADALPQDIDAPHFLCRPGDVCALVVGEYEFVHPLARGGYDVWRDGQPYMLGEIPTVAAAAEMARRLTN